MPRCKITVLKRTFHQDLVNTYLEEGCRPQGPCECFKEGQEIIVDPSKAPREFFSRCPWAWADIYKAIVNVASGANTIGAKQPGIVIAGCNDWFRPVIFKIERLGQLEHLTSRKSRARDFVGRIRALLAFSPL